MEVGTCIGEKQVFSLSLPSWRLLNDYIREEKNAQRCMHDALLPIAYDLWLLDVVFKFAFDLEKAISDSKSQLWKKNRNSLELHAF